MLERWYIIRINVGVVADGLSTWLRSLRLYVCGCDRGRASERMRKRNWRIREETRPWLQAAGSVRGTVSMVPRSPDYMPRARPCFAQTLTKFSTNTNKRPPQPAQLFMTGCLCEWALRNQTTWRIKSTLKSSTCYSYSNEKHVERNLL